MDRHKVKLMHRGKEIGRGEVDDFDTLFELMVREADRLGVGTDEIGIICIDDEDADE